MENIALHIALPGSFFLLMLLSGVFLSRKGKPYNQLLFALHKIVTILTIALVARLVFLLKAVEVASLTATLFWVFSSLFALSFVTGAFLSFEKPLPKMVVLTHRISSLLVTAVGLATIVLLLR